MHSLKSKHLAVFGLVCALGLLGSAALPQQASSLDYGLVRITFVDISRGEQVVSVEKWPTVPEVGSYVTLPAPGQPFDAEFSVVKSHFSPSSDSTAIRLNVTVGLDPLN